jgi:selenocysteine-specific elongation factor
VSCAIGAAEEGVSKEAALAQMIENLGNIALPDGSTPFNRSREYVYQEQLYGLEGRPCGQGSAGAWDEQSEAGGLRHYGPQWVLLNFEQPVTAPAVGAALCSFAGCTCHMCTCASK